MDTPTAQPVQHEDSKPRRTLSAWWMVLGAVLLGLVGLSLWIVLDVLPESRWMNRQNDEWATGMPNIKARGVTIGLGKEFSTRWGVSIAGDVIGPT